MTASGVDTVKVEARAAEDKEDVDGPCSAGRGTTMVLLRLETYAWKADEGRGTVEWGVVPEESGLERRRRPALELRRIE